MDSKKKCSTMEPAPTFPMARFCYLGLYRAYYPFGNIPAEDFLENCTDISQPSILVLGCGDLRSCFYTFWKNFDFSISTAPKKFDSISFTLNDYSAAILARNILFLYLCLQFPEGKTEKKKWLCAMWAIWYCHELYPSHLNILDASLKMLLTFSGSTERWSNNDNPLHQLVQFTSPSCLREVADMWSMWLNKTVHNVSVKNMKAARNSQSHTLNDVSEHCHNLSKDCTLIHGEEDELLARKIDARVPEVKSYVEIGSCYAEHVVDVILPRNQKTKANLTMYERQDGMYTFDYGLMPFQCFYHTIEFSPRFVKSRGVTLPYDVIVPSGSFESRPFLANSFQQFAMWIQSSSRILKGREVTVCFNFSCQDAVTFCQHQIKQNRMEFPHGSCTSRYDIITTSNLMDHVSPSNLVLACVPLLNVDGLLTTTSMCCKNCTNTGEELLNLCFGFDSQLFPVVLGVRCISHEGSNYSNSVKINPSPPDISHSLKCLPHVRTFAWVKVSNTQKLIFSQLPCVEDDNITEGLINMVGSYAYSLLNYGPGQSVTILSHNCIETACCMLQQFKCLCGESTSNYTFWEPLCTALKHTAIPFLHCLQTQILLHGIHAHLTISEEDCPVCQQKALGGTLGLFCAEVNLESVDIMISCRTPFFVVFVHRCTSRDAEFLLNEVREKRDDVHVFDCFDATTSNSTLLLKFFAPLMLLHQKYRVTVAMVHRAKPSNLYTTVVSATLKNMLTPWTEYDFYQTELYSLPDSTEINALFGTVTSHVSDGHQSETAISLSEATLEVLSTSKLCTDRVSSREVRLYCSSLTFQLILSYPINYDTVNIEVSKSRGSLTISCQRQRYSLEEERPCFIVSPDHQLSIVPITLSKQVMLSQSSMQLTREEKHLLQTVQPAQLSSTQLKVKLFLQVFFECAMSSSFFSIGYPENCLVVVNEILFDYQHKTPAIDLAFCFVNDFNQSDIVKKWEKVSHFSKIRCLPLEVAELKFLKTVFAYFSRRTNGTLTSKYSVLQKNDLGCAFTRCVLYFLLCDPDVKLYAGDDFLEFMMTTFLPKTGGVICAFCNKLIFAAKKCGRCTLVSYCSKKCQVRHWKSHKRQCIPAAKHHLSSHSSHSQCTFCKSKLEPSKMADSDCSCAGIQYCSMECRERHLPEHLKTCKGAQPRCSYCSQSHSCMKKCVKCRQVQYCNKDCQRKHWPEHKKVCIEFPATSAPTEKNVTLPTQSTCSFCNKPQSHLRKCTRCAEVQYCNRECQTRDWPEHKKTCTEAAVRQSSKNVSSNCLPKCAYCKKSSANLKKCTKCSRVQYCDRACQGNDWPEHKKVCTTARVL